MSDLLRERPADILTHFKRKLRRDFGLEPSINKEKEWLEEIPYAVANYVSWELADRGLKPRTARSVVLDREGKLSLAIFSAIFKPPEPEKAGLAGLYSYYMGLKQNHRDLVAGAGLIYLSQSRPEDPIVIEPKLGDYCVLVAPLQKNGEDFYPNPNDIRCLMLQGKEFTLLPGELALLIQTSDPEFVKKAMEGFFRDNLPEGSLEYQLAKTIVRYFTQYRPPATKESLFAFANGILQEVAYANQGLGIATAIYNPAKPKQPRAVVITPIPQPIRHQEPAVAPIETVDPRWTGIVQELGKFTANSNATKNASSESGYQCYEASQAYAAGLVLRLEGRSAIIDDAAKLLDKFKELFPNLLSPKILTVACLFATEAAHEQARTQGHQGKHPFDQDNVRAVLFKIAKLALLSGNRVEKASDWRDAALWLLDPIFPPGVPAQRLTIDLVTTALEKRLN